LPYGVRGKFFLSPPWWLQGSFQKPVVTHLSSWSYGKILSLTSMVVTREFSKTCCHAPLQLELLEHVTAAPQLGELGRQYLY